ncbi:MAG: TolC family protein, partial [Planctomycetota bacterium]
EQWVIRPEPGKTLDKTSEKERAGAGKASEPREPGKKQTAEEEAGGPVLELTLDKALEIAFAKNRDYLSRTESLYQQGLGLSLARFNFGPRLSSTVSMVWNDSELGRESYGASGNVGASQILPTGGSLSLAADISNGFTRGDPDHLYATGLSARLTQPLLRGAGYEVSHEALTQAERSLVYAIRSFELFRESFAIQIASAYFDLISRRETLSNEERNYDQALFDRKKAEGLYEVDRNTETEVFRARRFEIEAENSLIDQQSQFDDAKDRFKIQLGLPTSTRIRIVPVEPEVERVDIDLESAVEAAKHNRLDIHTQREQLEDTRRALRIARDALLPDLSLSLGYSLSGAGSRLHAADPKDWSSSVSLALEIPIQQKPERNRYRNALIALDQAERSFSLTLDNLELDIRNQLRNLKSLEKRIDIQIGQIPQDERAVKVTEIRYHAGTLDNRDLLEARQALIDRKNALIRQKVSHFIGRLRLMRSLGLLFIDENGMWR